MKNGKIEFLRFIFCMSVIFFHCNMLFSMNDIGNLSGLPITFMENGFISVEFFFIISGFFMARSIEKENNTLPETPIGKSTLKFMWNKYFSIFPYHISAFFIIALLNILHQKLYVDLLGLVDFTVGAIPNMLLIQKWGFDFDNINGPEWYLSAMFLAMYIIYPLCRKYYSIFTTIIAPLGAILLYGFMITSYGSFRGASTWCGIVYTCVLRATAGICTGIISYELSKKLMTTVFSHRQKILLTAIEIFGYLLIFIYIMMPTYNRCEIYAVIILLISITITLSNQTYGQKLFNRNIIYFLGNASLPLYLCQNAGFYITTNITNDFSIKMNIALTLIITFAAAFLCKIFGNKLMSILSKKHSQL